MIFWKSKSNSSVTGLNKLQEIHIRQCPSISFYLSVAEHNANVFIGQPGMLVFWGKLREKQIHIFIAFGFLSSIHTCTADLIKPTISPLHFTSPVLQHKTITIGKKYQERCRQVMTHSIYMGLNIGNRLRLVLCDRWYIKKMLWLLNVSVL